MGLLCDYHVMLTLGFVKVTRVVMWNIKRRGIKAGVRPFGVHTLRHLAASVLLSKGANIIKVQEYLGHTDLKTTQIYTHDLQTDEFDTILDNITRIEKGESEEKKKEPCRKTAKAPNI